MAGRPDGPLLMLTVEEAAALLRVGRTKAYAMTREWRATGGQSGLPVLDCGNVLRVPLHRLAEMLGADPAELVATVTNEPGDLDPDRLAAEPPSVSVPDSTPTPSPKPGVGSKRTRTSLKQAPATKQAPLFQFPAAS